MTFLFTQPLDDQDRIKVFAKSKKVIESVGEQQQNGMISGKARVKFEYDYLTKEDIMEAASLADAEQMVLTEGEIFWGYSSPPLNHIAEDHKLAHKISLAASNIMTHSKRGVGNTLICNPSDVEQVRACFDQQKTIQKYNPELEDMMDVEVPYFSSEPEVFETDRIEEGEVLVLYRGETPEDQAVVYVDGHGLAVNNKVAPAEFYGKFVHI